MNPVKPQETTAESDIRTALVCFLSLALKAEREQRRDLVREVKRGLRPTERQILESKAEDMLRSYRDEFTAEGIFKTVRDEIAKAFQESKTLKAIVVGTQGVAAVLMGFLLNNLEKLSPGMAWVAKIYIVLVVVTVVVAAVRKT